MNQYDKGKSFAYLRELRVAKLGKVQNSFRDRGIFSFSPAQVSFCFEHC